MNNYQYIIAGLPCLSPDFSIRQFSYDDVVKGILPLLSGKDRTAVEWIEHGSDPKHIGHHFYRGAAKCPNNFIRRWFEFDHNLRNAQVAWISSKEGVDGTKWTDGEFSKEFEDYDRLEQIFGMPDMIERERALDRLRWDKANELTTFHYFDIDVILGFLVKAKIVARWSGMDHEKGARMFETLVNEVRGTFKGVQFNENK